MDEPRPAPDGGTLPPLSRWPAVSVFIPARDSADTLEAAVASALEQRFDGSIEVVIAAAPSRDGTEELAGRLSQDHPRIRYRPNPAATTPAGLNAAIDTARGDVLVRLDAHAQLPPGYIARALELLRETGAGNVGGMQVPTGSTTFGRAVAAAMASPLGSGGPRYRVGGDPGEVETVYLGVFRREAIEAVGGFDETLIRNQDYELNHRLRTAGFGVYFHPDLRVTYQPRQTLPALWRQYLDYGAWKRHVAALHPGSLRLRQLVPPAFVLGVLGLLVVAAVTGVWWPVAAVVGVYLAVLLAGGLAAATAAGEPLRTAPLVAVALTAMHTAWGLGFLVGRRRGGDPHPAGTRDDG